MAWTIWLSMQSLPGSAPSGNVPVAYIYFGLLVALASLNAGFWVYYYRKQNLEGVNKKTVEDLRNAVMARDLTISDKDKLYAKLLSDSEALKLEYTAIVGIDMKEVHNFAKEGYQMAHRLLTNDNKNLCDTVDRQQRTIEAQQRALDMFIQKQNELTQTSSLNNGGTTLA